MVKPMDRVSLIFGVLSREGDGCAGKFKEKNLELDPHRRIKHRSQSSTQISDRSSDRIVHLI